MRNKNFERADSASARGDCPRFHRLMDEACVQFAQFAETPNRKPEEMYYFRNAFSYWYVISAIDPRLKKLLLDVKRKALALYNPLKQLEQLRDRGHQDLEQGTYKPDIAILDRLKPVDVAHLLGTLSQLADVAESLRHGPFSPAMPPNRARAYPGLSELVYHLEEAALMAGGAFFAHRKNGPKGSLVDALDWLRQRLQAGGRELEHLAHFLPLPGQHPIALYERNLKAARDQKAAQDLHTTQAARSASQAIPGMRSIEDKFSLGEPVRHHLIIPVVLRRNARKKS
jgi:hypothetical protein